MKINLLTKAFNVQKWMLLCGCKLQLCHFYFPLQQWPVRCVFINLIHLANVCAVLKPSVTKSDLSFGLWFGWRAFYSVLSGFGELTSIGSALRLVVNFRHPSTSPLLPKVMKFSPVYKKQQPQLTFTILQMQLNIPQSICEVHRLTRQMTDWPCYRLWHYYSYVTLTTLRKTSGVHRLIARLSNVVLWWRKLSWYGRWSDCSHYKMFSDPGTHKDEQVVVMQRR